MASAKVDSQSGFVRSGERTVSREQRDLSHQRAFVAMNREQQRCFIAHRFTQLDVVELANIFRAIFTLHAKVLRTKAIEIDSWKG